MTMNPRRGATQLVLTTRKDCRMFCKPQGDVDAKTVSASLSWESWLPLFAAGGTAALTLDLDGSVSGDQRVELQELVGLGVLVVCGLGFFAWRRFFRTGTGDKEAQSGRGSGRASLAHHDHLTGLPNRRQLQEALHAAVDDTAQCRARPCDLLPRLEWLSRKSMTFSAMLVATRC